MSLMSGTRVALLIGCSDYEDLGFPQLPAPVQDISALKRVLANPSIGDFAVETVFNRPSAAVSEEIENFFADRKPDDLLLLYFSCHGVLDAKGRLSFVAANTKKGRLDSTGISARWVTEQMDQSRSQRIVLLLDCCYSGAFSGGLRRRSADVEEISEQFKGCGRVVITASDKLEYAYGSEFTNAVVRGLETGAADLDGDGQVAVGELYDYVYDQVRQKSPDQTPTMSADGMRGKLYLAKNPHAESPLPAELRQILGSQLSWERLWAVDGLMRLMAGDVPGGQKRTARRELLRLRDNDTSPDIQAAAGEVLHKISLRPRATDRRPQRKRRLAIGGLVLMIAVGTAIIVPRVIPPDEMVAHTSIPCSPSTRSRDGILSFGTLLPKNTGAFVYTGPALDAGVQLAMKDINEAGGIPSLTAVKLDLGNQRDEDDPATDTASRSIDELLSHQVDVIIGPATSAVALKVIDKVTCAGAILFSPANTAQVLTTYPDRGLYFRTASSSVTEGTVLGKLVVADGNSTAVVMSRDDVYGNDLRAATVTAIQQSGGKVLDSFHYDPKARNYTNDIQRIKDKNPDAIVLIGFSESASILSDMIQKGLNPKNKRIYGSTANFNNTLAGQVDPQDLGVLAGMRGAVPEVGDDMFVKRLREANPGLHNLNYAAQAYDAVVITALAAAVAGTDEPAAIAKEINSVTKGGEKCTSFSACMMLVKNRKDIAYGGPSGPLEFSDPGESGSATYLISEIQADNTVKTLRKERVGLVR
jgi:ABC-type branched-subunit amino acid transport system substrate-binding protein